MSNFGPAPSRMTRKISPSVDPRSHLASVRSEGCVPSGAIGPLPFASGPWQNRQFFWKIALPAATDSGVAGTGFFIFLPSALPPGFCARATAAHAHTSTPISPLVIRRIGFDLLVVLVGVPILCQTTPPKQRSFGGWIPADGYAIRKIVRRLPRDDDRHLVVADERAVVGAAAQHVGARLAEGDLHGHLAVGRQRGGNPDRRPRRVRAGARVFPR